MTAGKGRAQGERLLIGRRQRWGRGLPRCGAGLPPPTLRAEGAPAGGGAGARPREHGMSHPRARPREHGMSRPRARPHENSGSHPRARPHGHGGPHPRARPTRTVGPSPQVRQGPTGRTCPTPRAAVSSLMRVPPRAHTHGQSMSHPTVPLCPAP